MSTQPNPLASIGSFLTGISTDIGTVYTAINKPPSLTRPSTAPTGAAAANTSTGFSPSNVSTWLWVAVAAVVVAILVVAISQRRSHR